MWTVNYNDNSKYEKGGGWLPRYPKPKFKCLKVDIHVCPYSFYITSGLQNLPKNRHNHVLYLEGLSDTDMIYVCRGRDVFTVQTAAGARAKVLPPKPEFQSLNLAG